MYPNVDTETGTLILAQAVRFDLHLRLTYIENCESLTGLVKFAKAPKPGVSDGLWENIWQDGRMKRP